MSLSVQHHGNQLLVIESPELITSVARPRDVTGASAYSGGSRRAASTAATSGVIIIMSSAQAPNISQDELSAFYKAHFSGPAVSHFDTTFVKPAAIDTNDHQGPDSATLEEDDLGYYDDGVKRTLTDAQIEIFRHSELKSLRRDLEKDASKRKSQAQITAAENPDVQTDSSQLKEADLPTHFRSSKKRKKTRQKAEPKPDLRKRTWDVVEKGLDSLEYD